MPDEVLKIDANYKGTVGGVTNDSAQDITILRVNPTTKRLLIEQSALDASLDSVTVSDGTIKILKVSLTASAPTNTTIGVTSTLGIGLNTNRKGLVLGNNSGGTMSFGVNNAAVLNSGITLLSGGIWVMDDYTFSTGSVNAIASGTGILSIQEFT